MGNVPRDLVTRRFFTALTFILFLCKFFWQVFKNNLLWSNKGFRLIWLIRRLRKNFSVNFVSTLACNFKLTFFVEVFGYFTFFGEKPSIFFATQTLLELTFTVDWLIGGYSGFRINKASISISVFTQRLAALVQ